jgi:hypothetical protein
MTDPDARNRSNWQRGPVTTADGSTFIGHDPFRKLLAP